MIEHASASSLLSLSKFLLQWLQGLSHASEARKVRCIDAIDRVIAATRETQRYCTERDRAEVDSQKEGQLASMWTDLSFELERVGVKKLAKRCDVKGRYWGARGSQEKFSEEWLNQADITLEAVAQLARRIKAEIRTRGAPK
jgi:hypothetical protein